MRAVRWYRNRDFLSVLGAIWGVTQVCLFFAFIIIGVVVSHGAFQP